MIRSSRFAARLLEKAASVGRFEFPIEQTQATTAAAANFERNRAALHRAWPRAVLTLPDQLPELEWLYARDGSLSARHVDRQWLGDCSVPRKAAERMLANLIVNGTTSALLAPTHAPLIRAALSRMTSRQALIAIIPGEHTAGAIMACDDFVTEIETGRLWIAAGPDWQQELSAILDGNEGLAPVSSMIRVPGLNTHILEMIQKPCDRIFAKHGESHRQRADMLLNKPRFPATPAKKLCAVTGAFQLWDSGGDDLRALADVRDPAIDCVHIDASHPATASTLHLARQADGCDALVIAELGRADAPPVVPTNVPWITWLTRPRVPACPPDAARDLLFVAEDSLRDAALIAGWPPSRVHIASSPLTAPPSDENAAPAIIADLMPIEMPASIRDMSSHRGLWERIADEFAANPTLLPVDVGTYVCERAARIGVPRENVPMDVLVRLLIEPLFMREAARLIARRWPTLSIYGRGWDAVAELRSHWRGAIANGPALDEALRSTSTIIDVWPTRATHAARRAGRPVVDAKTALRLNRHDLAAVNARSDQLSLAGVARAVDQSIFSRS